MPALFEPLKIKDVTLRNRIAVSPLCQYSAENGLANDWHLVNLGAFARGGAGLVVAEATAVVPEGRITPYCLGIWNTEQAQALAPMARFVKKQGAVPGIQIAHAGRKASANRPWEGDQHIPPDDPRAWQPVGPSANAYGGSLPRVPHELSVSEIKNLSRQFADAARRALDAGFEFLMLHYAHGYLAQSFFSPIANKRRDEYGGSFENRIRFPMETLRLVREVWPERLPLAARLGVTDFNEASQPLEESIELIKRMKSEGLDLIDVSFGFNSPDVSGVPWGPAMMVPAARRIKRETGIVTGASWYITEPAQADAIIREGQMDLVFIGRAMLSDPHWAFHAAQELKVANPQQYLPEPYTWGDRLIPRPRTQPGKPR